MSTTDMHMHSKDFCRFLDQGLVYNNNTVDFTVSPCCYFSRSDSLDIKGDIPTQIDRARQIWLQSDWKKTCRICLDQEHAGEISYRQSSFNMIPDSHGGVAMLTVAVNKQCNLACASCGPESSSFWFQHNRRHGIHQDEIIVDLHRDDRLGEIKHRFLSVFDQGLFDNLSYIKFGGGEPLMSTTHELILEKLPNPAEITVQYTSNFSIEPSDRVLELWSRFRLVKWCASIDAQDQQFEILRWPHRWQDLQHMIQRMIARVPHNVMFGVEHTLNPLNVWYFDRFQQWMDTHFACNRYGDQTDLNLHACTGELDLRQTPPALRQDLAARLGIQHPAVRFLQQYPYSGSSERLTNWMHQLDQRRCTQWRQIFAEVAHYYP